MKLLLLVLAAFCPLLVSAQSFFDYINPFYWLYNVILDTVIAEDAVCDLIDGALEIASGQGDAIQCSCNNVVNVFLFFPIGITSQAACSSNASFDLNTLPVSAIEFDLSVAGGFGDVINLVFGGAVPGLTINNFTGCLTVDGNKICADYTGFIRLSGLEVASCEINIGTDNCNCQICDGKETVKFACPSPYSLLTTLGQCVSPLLVDT